MPINLQNLINFERGADFQNLRTNALGVHLTPQRVYEEFLKQIAATQYKTIDDLKDVLVRTEEERRLIIGRFVPYFDLTEIACAVAIEDEQFRQVAFPRQLHAFDSVPPQQN